MWILMVLISQAPLTAPPASPPSLDCFIGGGLGVAPSNAPLRLDLPASRNVDGGILIAPERAADVAWRMDCLQRWPRACQVTLDAQAQAASVELSAQQRVTREVAKLRLDEQPSKAWPAWLVAVIAGGAGAAVGLSAGLIMGFTAR